MNRCRNSSHSPCWSSFYKEMPNKENVNLENIVSFKNLVNKRQFKKTGQSSLIDGYTSIYSHPQELTPREHSSNMPDNKDQQRKSKSKSELKETQLKSIIKSKDKQLVTLSSQVKVLENTISLLKDQVDSLSQAPLRPEVDRLHKQNLNLKKQLSEFQAIVPKLNELQVIQNSLIEENQRLKAKEENTNNLVREILALVRPEQIKIIQMLGAIIN